MLRQVYRDLIKLAFVLGFFWGCIICLLMYIRTGDTNFIIFSFVFGSLGGLTRVAKLVYVVELWRAIVSSWRRQKKQPKPDSNDKADLDVKD